VKIFHPFIFSSVGHLNPLPYSAPTENENTLTGVFRCLSRIGSSSGPAGQLPGAQVCEGH